jgi:imidazoleglycerol-phosphate dehydratase
MNEFSVSHLKVVNEGKAGVPILTGIGFFDHMIDQFNSHAQIGVGLQVDVPSCSDDVSNHNRLAGTNQVELCEAVGAALGSALFESLSLQNQLVGATSRFCCPLDEALVECIIEKASGEGSLVEYTLAPYGIFPKGQGRSKIGQWETAAISSFWSELAKKAQLNVSFRKVRGDNGHHIVESSFKAFSRALRQFLDAPTVFDSSSPNDQASVALAREATIERATKETSIYVNLVLNGSSEDTNVETGIPALDDFFTLLAREARMTLQINCDGDLWVDDHHTAEDVSIAVGQCLTEALGTKAGLNRMGVASSGMVEVTMDLSNRPYLGHDLHETLGREEYVDVVVSNGSGTTTQLSCEMLEHVLDSLVMNGRMTVHIVETTKEGATATSVTESVMATARALGRALRVCAMVDIRRAGQTASSKGTLSV